MARKDQKKALTYQESLTEALSKFDLKAFKEWMQKFNKPLWNQFKKSNKTVQMATMCKCICNKTNLLATEAHRKAVKWLVEHDTKGQIF